MKDGGHRKLRKAWSSWATKCNPRPTRIAYLKRMLKRLEGVNLRVQDLMSVGELTPQAAELAAQQITANRNALLAELVTLDRDDPTG